MDSRTKLLLGVLAFVGLFAVWTWIGPGGDEPEPMASAEEIAPLHAPGAGHSAAAGAPVERVEELRSAALAIQASERAPGRDPWRFGAAPRTLETTRPMHPSVPAARPAPAAPVQLPPVPDAAPEPPVFPWLYLGSFGPASRRIAVFAESAAPGAPVQNRREGETVAERFVLERIGIESVDVRPLSIPGAPAQRLVPGVGRDRRVS